MKRWGLAFALLLSLGVNLGVLGTMAVHRLRPPEAGPEAGEPPLRQGESGLAERSAGSPSGETGQLPTDGSASRPPGSSSEQSPGPPPGTSTGPVQSPGRPAGTSTGPVSSPGRPPGTSTGSVQGTGRPPGSSPSSGSTAGRPSDRSTAPDQGEDYLPDRPPRQSPGGTEPGRSEGMPQMRLERFADRLGLQGEVRERFIAQQRGFFLATARDRQRLRRIHAELRRELAAPEPDRARADRFIEEAGRTYLELERAMVANVLATREMLDPEQERLFLEFVGRRGPGRLVAPEQGERGFPQRRRRQRRYFGRP